MAIHDHYLAEDFVQVTDNLEIMQKSLMAILETATTATFENADQAIASFEKSFQVLEALNKKKLERDQYDPFNEYTRRNFF